MMIKHQNKSISIETLKQIKQKLSDKRKFMDELRNNMVSYNRFVTEITDMMMSKRKKME